ncbi:MAG TPA: hypothetical protein VH988_10830 [Thermoanaerobaculia bacterium]|jgi:hypothetical protein|nr:hypothetical protein [Thermoanaerobaculia bacterium]
MIRLGNTPALEALLTRLSERFGLDESAPVQGPIDRCDCPKPLGAWGSQGWHYRTHTVDSLVDLQQLDPSRKVDFENALGTIYAYERCLLAVKQQPTPELAASPSRWEDLWTPTNERTPS